MKKLIPLLLIALLLTACGAAPQGNPDLQITRSTGSDEHHACAIFSLRLNKKIRTEALLVGVKSTEGVLALEEL